MSNENDARSASARAYRKLAREADHRPVVVTGSAEVAAENAGRRLVEDETANKLAVPPSSRGPWVASIEASRALAEGDREGAAKLCGWRWRTSRAVPGERRDADRGGGARGAGAVVGLGDRSRRQAWVGW